MAGNYFYKAVLGKPRCFVTDLQSFRPVGIVRSSVLASHGLLVTIVWVQYLVLTNIYLLEKYPDLT